MSDKKCSLKVVSSNNGRLLHGTAAINHMITKVSVLKNTETLTIYH